MHKVIANGNALHSWLEGREHGNVKSIIHDSGATMFIKQQMEIMDRCYGEERDIEKDLGGYMVIFFGADDEVQKEYKQILQYHQLKEGEYEYEECYNTTIGNKSIKVRLYLCSSDYGIIMVSIAEK